MDLSNILIPLIVLLQYLSHKKNVSNSCAVTDRFRLVVDYHFLNPAIKDSVCGSQYVSSIDFNRGYHQIPCADRVEPIIAFSPGYGFGQWTWNVMPQGIKPASSLFQRTMEQTFPDLSDCILPPFYDDVVIKGSYFMQHVSNVRQVLTRIQQSGLTLNALKCKFFQRTLPILLTRDKFGLTKLAFSLSLIFHFHPLQSR